MLKKFIALVIATLAVTIFTGENCTALAGSNQGMQYSRTVQKDYNVKELENVLVFWVNGPELKAVSLMSVNPRGWPVGIIAIPTITCLGEDQKRITVAALFARKGRQAVMEQLEKHFQSPIDRYITIHNQGLEEASRAIGPIMMGDKKTTLLEVFEGTYVNGAPVDLQDEIRTLAVSITKPSVMVKIPYMTYIFATQFESNMQMGNVLKLYRTVYHTGPEVLQKCALPGTDFFVDSEKKRMVTPDEWTKTLSRVTA